jgi:endonuclease YncB( thermonuclease family)
MPRLTALLAALILFAPASLAQVEPGQSFTARVVEVTDGYTYDVRRSIGGAVTIRLHGVDAPETSQPYGRAATRAARRLVGGQNVRVSVEEIGRYGRAVASVEVGGGDLSALLIGVLSGYVQNIIIILITQDRYSICSCSVLV